MKVFAHSIAVIIGLLATTTAIVGCITDSNAIEQTCEDDGSPERNCVGDQAHNLDGDSTGTTDADSDTDTDSDADSDGDGDTDSEPVTSSHQVLISFTESYIVWDQHENQDYTRILLGPPENIYPQSWTVLADTDAMSNPDAEMTWVPGALVVIPERWHGLEVRLAFHRYTDLEDLGAGTASSWAIQKICIGTGTVESGPTVCNIEFECSDSDGYYSIPGPYNTDPTVFRCAIQAPDPYFFHQSAAGTVSDAYLLTVPFTVPTPQ